jgi:tetratricopeptide (TPR) repeat protein
MNADALSAYWRGRALLERRDLKGNPEAALAAFDEALAQDPRFADAHAARGEALWADYLDSKDPPLAQAAVDAGFTALRINPNSAHVRYSLALTLFGNGRLSDAVEELQHAVTLQPNFDDALRLLGTVLARQGRIDDATAEIQKAIALRPGYWDHYSALGQVLLQAGRFAEAAGAFRKVTELQPDNAFGYQQLGTVQQTLGDDEGALANYERALKLRPTAQAYSNIGAFWHRKREYARAVEAYSRALALRPNSAATHRNLGDALLRLGRTGDARTEYREAVRLAEAELQVNPRDGRNLAALAVYLAKAGDQAAAAGRIARANELSGNELQVIYRTAVVYTLQGRADDAMALLERLVGLGYPLRSIVDDDDFEPLTASPRFQKLISPVTRKGDGR